MRCIHISYGNVGTSNSAFLPTHQSKRKFRKSIRLNDVHLFVISAFLIAIEPLSQSCLKDVTCHLAKYILSLRITS